MPIQLKEEYNLKLEISYVLGRKKYENSDITIENIDEFIDKIYNNWLEFDKDHEEISILDSLYKYLDLNY